MALHSVSYALTVVVPTATRVVGWNRGYLRPYFHVDAQWSERHKSDKRWQRGLWSSTTNIKRQKYTSREDRGHISIVINTYSHTTAALITVRTRTHTYLTTLNNIWTRVHCTRYYTSKTNVLQRDLEKHAYSICVFLFVQGYYILLPVYVHLFCF